MTKRCRSREGWGGHFSQRPRQEGPGAWTRRTPLSSIGGWRRMSQGGSGHGVGRAALRSRLARGSVVPAQCHSVGKLAQNGPWPCLRPGNRKGRGLWAGRGGVCGPEGEGFVGRKGRGSGPYSAGEPGEPRDSLEAGPGRGSKSNVKQDTGSVPPPGSCL